MLLNSTKTFAIYFFCAINLYVQLVRTQVQMSAHFRKILDGALIDEAFQLPDGHRRCSGTLGCTLINCARLCARHVACQSLGFRKKSRKCYHYGVLASDPAAHASAVSDEGWATWEKTGSKNLSTGQSTTTSATTSSPPATTTTTTTTVATTTTTPDWLGSGCSSDEDCTVSKATCYKSKCICRPRSYYSVGSKTCIDLCSVENLQTTYTFYPSGGFEEYGSDAGKVDSPSACNALCTADSTCVHAGAWYNKNKPTCYLYDVKPGPGSSYSWSEDWDGWDTYQRHCA